MLNITELKSRAAKPLPQFRKHPAEYQRIWRARKALGLLPDRTQSQVALIAKNSSK
jgi:hypothetical protein